MNPKKLPIKILFVGLLSSSSVLNLFAQCEGVYFKTAYRKLTAERVIFVPEQQATPQRFKDLTGDGVVDLIGTGIEEGNQTRKIYIYPSDGAGGFGSVIELTLPSPMLLNSNFFPPLKVADFNNDNLNDLFIVYATSPPSAQVYQNNGNGSFTPLNTTTLQNGEFIINVVDINTDQIADIVTGVGNGATTGYRLASANGRFGNFRSYLP